MEHDNIPWQEMPKHNLQKGRGKNRAWWRQVVEEHGPLALWPWTANAPSSSLPSPQPRAYK